MAAFENTVTINRPAEEVFAYLADAENIPRWNYAIEQTRKITPGPVTLVARVHGCRRTARTDRPNCA